MKTLAELECAVTTAMSALDDADKECGVVSSKRTDAINKANNAQKEFDLAIGKLKGLANRSTDWGRSK